jgi:hypothetical protein
MQQQLAVLAGQDGGLPLFYGKTCSKYLFLLQTLLSLPLNQRKIKYFNFVNFQTKP